MGYTDDWESLMNGVFGPGGKLRYDVQKPPEKTGLPDLNAALLEQQKKLDEMLKKQNAALRGGTAQETLAQSRKMLEEMEADGLLAKGTAEVGQEHLGSFEGLAAEVKKTVLGQDAFVDGVVRAMRRPFVLGTEPPTARNVILLCGAPGTGRHFTLTETARCMAARGLLRSDRLAVMDLALYPGSGAEKLFLQDLYATLHAPGEIVVFEHYESCCPGFLKTLADLAVRGSAPLSSRYLVNKEGILVDAGTALAPGAVSRITPCGKYLVFFSRKGRAALADRFGAPFVSALGDVCETAPFAREDLAALAAQQLNALAAKVKARLGLTLAAGADVRDYVADQCSPQQGVAGLTACCDRMFRALSEYCLQTDAALTGTVSLTAREGGIDFALNGGEAQKLFDLLPSWVGIGVCVLLFILTMNVRLTYANGMISPGYIGIPNLFAIKLPMEAYNVGVLFPLGLHNASFSSSDYFPMMPWFFLFLAGSYFGIIAKAGRLPKFCYPTHIKWLAAVGRYTIWIYVLHQPVLYGIFSLIFHR